MPSKINHLIGFGGGGGAGLSNNDAIAVDGDDYGELDGAALTGVSNGKAGTISFWAKATGNDTQHRYLFCMGTGSGTPYSVLLNLTNADLWQFYIRKAADSAYGIAAVDDVVYKSDTNTGWHHHLISWDVAVAGSFRWYIDDVDASVTPSLYVDADLEYTVSRARICDDIGFGGAYVPFYGEVFDFWMSLDTYFDFDVAANRRKFVTAGIKPVNLGSDGSNPGATPVVYFALDDGAAAANFLTNRGSGQNFTESGTLVVAGDSPSD